MGAGGAFDDAIGEFTIENADQNERDYRQLVTAVKEGRIEAIADVSPDLFLREPLYNLNQLAVCVAG